MGHFRAYCETHSERFAKAGGVVLPTALLGLGYSGSANAWLAHTEGFELTELIREASLRPRARTTGVVYLLYFLTAILAQLLVGRKLVAYGNAANLIATGLYIALTLLFFGMFKPVNRYLSLIAALFSLAGCVVMTLGLFLPSLPINPLLFFGPYCLMIGYLVFKSTFLPRILGVLLILAGLGWLAFLLPQVTRNLSTCIEALGIFAEASLMIWLIVRGVNVQRWKELAGAV
jgi:hypothetical protein